MIKIKTYDEKDEKLFKVIGIKNKTVLLWCEEHSEFKNITMRSIDKIEYLDEDKKKGFEVKRLVIGYKTKKGLQELDVTDSIKKYLKETFEIEFK